MPLRVSRIEWLLLLLTLIWGSNFSVIKTALEEFPPLPFNALRMALASAIFFGLLGRSPVSRLSRRDWPVIITLGLVGHFLYQVCFMEGIARTSVANSSLILGATPIAVAILMWCGGRESLSTTHWLGIGLSLVGVYLVVGQGTRINSASLTGDLLMMAAVWCWAAYTVSARSMLERYSPLVVTAWSMAVGTVLFIPLGLPGLLVLNWRDISFGAWVGLVYSAIFALCVSYLIWYTAVQRIGSARTSIYSNMVPVVAMVVAAAWLLEPISTMQIGGAVSIFAGVALTKVRPPHGC
ncbi:MAG: DMT family transporter [Acidobacteriota bacterium]|nr:DMT family transporter [Acidobacteriota bacterium]